MKLFLITFLCACHLSSGLHGGEYPTISQNYGLDVMPDIDGIDPEGHDAEVRASRFRNYILVRNQLLDITQKGFLQEANPDDETSTGFAFGGAEEESYTAYQTSPRCYLVGKYQKDKGRFILEGHKYILPVLHHLPGVTCPGREENYLNEDGHRIGYLWGVQQTPECLRDEPKSEQRLIWKDRQRYHFKLEPSPKIEFTPEKELFEIEKMQKREYSTEIKQMAQGLYQLGGAVVCSRRENGDLTMYRLPGYQRKEGDLEVFDQEQLIRWDDKKSDLPHLTAFKNLRKDLLEHNTGLTENKIYVRMQRHQIKIDRPGETKAMLDWYILAPFYDPKTKTYRDSLLASDFTASDGFDPKAKGFKPNRFIKKLVPFTLPQGFLKEAGK